MRKFCFCRIVLLVCILFATIFVHAQTHIDSILPIRGLSIAAPTPKVVDSFVTFINQELAPRRVNVLVLRVDYHYQFKSRPELADSTALSLADVKR